MESVKPKKKYKKNPENGPVGRPRTKLSDLPENWEQIMTDIAQEGGSKVSAKVALGLFNNTWETLHQDSEEFRVAVKKCDLLCQHWWENRGKEMSKGSPGSANVWKFNMQNRFGWRENVNIGEDPTAPFQGQEKKQLTDDEMIEECKKRGLPLTMFEKVIPNDN
jgi:hypothetical protein